MNLFARNPDQLYFQKEIPSGGSGEYSMTPEMLRILSIVNDEKSLAQLSDETGYGTEVLKANLERLIAAGLLSAVEDGDEDCLDENFLNPLLEHMQNAVGPMADILIDGVLEDMDLEWERIPVETASELILNLSREIPDPEMALAFKRSMIKLIPRQAA